MNKKLCTIISIVLIIGIITTATVFARTMKEDFALKRLGKEFTPDDVHCVTAIMVLSDENMSATVKKKYREMKDWDKVAESYGIDLKSFHEFVETQKRIEENLDIPENIYEEMKSKGMSFSECREMAQEAFNANIKIEKVWEASKIGKTVDDLIAEDTDIKNAKLQAAGDFAYGKISAKEFFAKIKELSPEMSDEEIAAFAEKERKELERFRKSTSKITEAEIAAANKKGITNIFDICKIKDAEIFSELTFSQMLEKVEKGETVDAVIKNNVSKTKIEALKKRSENK